MGGVRRMPFLRDIKKFLVTGITKNAAISAPLSEFCEPVSSKKSLVQLAAQTVENLLRFSLFFFSGAGSHWFKSPSEEQKFVTTLIYRCSNCSNFS